MAVVMKWEEIIGQEKAVVQLKTLMQAERMPHALLFCGPDGVGKLLVAQVLAAALLCEHTNGPCGQCASCQAFRMGMHPDMYTIVPESKGKTAKSIKIEQIREVQTEVARIPYLSDKRVVLFDGADTMNEAAANRLLKTLEEPTGQVVFILITGKKASLLDTIVSRCMMVNFCALPRPALAKALCARDIPEPVAAELAALADGSFGKALELFENGGLILRDETLDFMEQLSAMEMPAVWELAQKLGGLTREKLQEWLSYLTMLLRDMLVLYSTGASELLYNQTAAERIAGLLPDFSERKVFALLENTKLVETRLSSNVNTRLLMEQFLLKIRELS